MTKHINERHPNIRDLFSVVRGGEARDVPGDRDHPPPRARAAARKNTGREVGHVWRPHLGRQVGRVPAGRVRGVFYSPRLGDTGRVARRHRPRRRVPRAPVHLLHVVRRVDDGVLLSRFVQRRPYREGAGERKVVQDLLLPDRAIVLVGAGRLGVVFVRVPVLQEDPTALPVRRLDRHVFGDGGDGGCRRFRQEINSFT